MKQIYELVSTKQFLDALVLQRRLLDEDANITEQLVQAKIEELITYFEKRPNQSLETSYARDKQSLKNSYDFTYLQTATMRMHFRDMELRME